MALLVSIIRIHSGLNLFPRLGARSRKLRAHILRHKDEAERTNQKLFRPLHLRACPPVTPPSPPTKAGLLRVPSTGSQVFKYSRL